MFGRWSEHPENLFLVEPYVFFPGQRVTSRSLLEAERCAHRAPAVAVLGSSTLQMGLSITGARLPPVSRECMQTGILQTYRDEVADHGMLSIARDVLLRVHDRVFEALSTPPTRGPGGKPVFAKWDVPHILQLERSEVRECSAASRLATLSIRRAAGCRLTLDSWLNGHLDHQQHRVSAAAQPGLVCCSACSKQASCKQARVGTLVRVQVLRGVVIMFSRIIPLDEVPSQHALWLRAEAFGARCTAQTDDAVTHLVTNTQHTLKVRIAT